jgi:hypothetical protein
MNAGKEKNRLFFLSYRRGRLKVSGIYESGGVNCGGKKFHFPAAIAQGETLILLKPYISEDG